MSEVDGSNTTDQGNVEDLSQYEGDEGLVLRWLKEINLVRESKAQRSFETIGTKIVRNYRNADVLSVSSAANGSPSRVMFNVLWSNVQILKPSLFCRIPKVVVERRFKDTDDIGRVASMIAERCTSFMIQTQQDRFMYAVKAAVEDRLLPGRGQVWLRYVADFEDGDPEQVDGEDVAPNPDDVQQVIKPNSERVIIDPLFWMDYFHNTARNPYEIRWQARRVYMTRAQLIARFGEKKGKACKLLADTDGVKKKKLSYEEEQFFMQAEVFEIWDFEKKHTVFISEGYKEGPLDIKPDVLHLDGFFPCPVPLLATTTTDSMFPTPDYKIYERLADEVDYVTKRISSLVECIRFVGAIASQYNADVKNMLALNDGQLWPVDGFAQWAEKGGMKGFIDWLPFDNAVNAIGPLTAYRDSLLGEIDLITGIPDIARGQTDPNETADAQQRKSKWAVLKLQDKQADVQRFCREIISKMAEIIFENGLFLDQTIALMCGLNEWLPNDQQFFGPALQLLRDDRLRTFRVDIETDSTIAIDEEVDQASRMEYMTAVGNMMQGLQSAMQFRPEVVKPMIETTLFAIRGFRTGRPLEGSWEKCMQEIQHNDSQPKEPPPPDPMLIKAQSDAQVAQTKVQIEGMKAQNAAMELQAEGGKLQFEQYKAQHELAMQAQKDQAEFTIASQKNQIELMKLEQKKEIDTLVLRLEAFKEQFNQALETKLVEIEQSKAIGQMQERMIEESRLAREQQLEHSRIINERIDAMTNNLTASNERTSSILEKLQTPAVSAEPREVKPPIVNVHLGGSKRIEYDDNGKPTRISHED